MKVKRFIEIITNCNYVFQNAVSLLGAQQFNFSLVISLVFIMNKIFTKPTFKSKFWIVKFTISAYTSIGLQIYFFGMTINCSKEMFAN